MEYCFKFRTGEKEELTLNEDQRNELNSFIMAHLKPIKKCWVSSYFVKHQLERHISTGYISNADCKRALTECGFFHKEFPDNPNWNFNISKKSLEELRKMSGRWFY